MDEAANSEGDPAPAALGRAYVGELPVQVGLGGKLLVMGNE